MKERIDHITFLQFIGPIFVVLGHSANGMPTSESYYLFSKEWIYIFHMPLFFFISGYIFSYKKGLEGKAYGNFILGKYKRLLIPYIIWNLLFIVPKFIMSNFIADDVEFSFTYLISVFITPRDMIWGHTWFLAALFILFLIGPIFNLLMTVKWNKPLVWSSITTILIIWYLFPTGTDFLALYDLSKNTLFFWIGIMIGQVPIKHLKNVVTKPIVYSSIFFATIILTIFRLTISDLSIITMVTCLATIIALLLIPIIFNLQSKVIDKLGQRAFGIYILHWPVMLSVQIILYKMIGLDSSLVIFIMAISGYVVPNLILEFLNRFKVKKFEKPQRYLLGA